MERNRSPLDGGGGGEATRRWEKATPSPEAGATL
jgi:hypothetical protein